jgi:PKHD-type hydroxylase
VPDYRTHQVHPELFSAEECDLILDLARELPVEHAALEGHGGVDTDESLRSASIAWMPRDEASSWIFERLAAVCDAANEDYGFDLRGFDEDLQFTTYDRPGAFYTWHQDGLDAPVATRKLSIVVQLSDPSHYEGADLELFQVVEDYDEAELEEFRRCTRRRGTAVVFPAFEYHRVTPLRSGTRHSLVCWVGGPPFR